ncbi:MULTISPECIES: hypothetical protein [unclassified Streptomyces]|uniref:hypothetical protein n=1 Tax=unclassified Streptomyces TaxID=2593676 RepID=UPI003D76527E
MVISGDEEERRITPAVWEKFADWWGDKAYRQAGFVEELEALVRSLAANDVAHLQTELRECAYGEELSSRDVRDAMDLAYSAAKGDL